MRRLGVLIRDLAVRGVDFFVELGIEEEGEREGVEEEEDEDEESGVGVGDEEE